MAAGNSANGTPASKDGSKKSEGVGPHGSKRNSVTSHIVRKHTSLHKAGHFGHHKHNNKSGSLHHSNSKKKVGYIEALKKTMVSEQIQQKQKEMTPAQLMAEFHPTPIRRSVLDTKFTYFYKPYNYLANTQKFMKFQEEPTPEILEEHKALEPCWSNLEVTPWTQSRPESTIIHKRAIEEFTRDGDDCQSWRDVHNFMFSGDENTFTFVRNQLMRMLGVKRPRKKKEKRRFLSSIKTELLYHKSVHKSRRGSFRALNSGHSHRSPSPDIDGDESSQYSFKKKQIHSNKTSPNTKQEKAQKATLSNTSQPLATFAPSKDPHAVQSLGMKWDGVHGNQKKISAKLNQLTSMVQGDDYQNPMLNRGLTQTISMPIQEVDDSESSRLLTEIESAFSAEGGESKGVVHQSGQKKQNSKRPHQKQVIQETMEEHDKSSRSSVRSSASPKLNLQLIGVKVLRISNRDSNSESQEVASAQSSSFFHKSADDEQKSQVQSQRASSDRDGAKHQSTFRPQKSKRKRVLQNHRSLSMIPSNKTSARGKQQAIQMPTMEKQQSTKVASNAKNSVAEENEDSVDSDNYATDSEQSIKKRENKRGASRLNRSKKQRQQSFVTDKALSNTLGSPLKFKRGSQYSRSTIKSVKDKQLPSLALRLANAIRFKMAIVMQDSSRRKYSLDSSISGSKSEITYTRFLAAKQSSIINLEKIPLVQIDQSSKKNPSNPTTPSQADATALYPSKKTSGGAFANHNNLTPDSKDSNFLQLNRKQTKKKYSPRNGLARKSTQQNSPLKPMLTINRKLSIVKRSNSSRKHERQNSRRTHSRNSSMQSPELKQMAAATADRNQTGELAVVTGGADKPFEFKLQLEGLADEASPEGGGKRQSSKNQMYARIGSMMGPESTASDNLLSKNIETQKSVKRGQTQEYSTLINEFKLENKTINEENSLSESVHGSQTVDQANESSIPSTSSPTIRKILSQPIASILSGQEQYNTDLQLISGTELQQKLLSVKDQNSCIVPNDASDEQSDHLTLGAIIKAETLLKTSQSEQTSFVSERQDKYTPPESSTKNDDNQDATSQAKLEFLDQIAKKAQNGITAIAQKDNNSQRQQQVIILRKRHAQKPVLHDFTRLLGRRENYNTHQEQLPMASHPQNGTLDQYFSSHDKAFSTTTSPNLKSLLATGTLQKQIKARLDHESYRGTRLQKEAIFKPGKKSSPPRELSRPTPLITLTEVNQDKMMVRSHGQDQDLEQDQAQDQNNVMESSVGAQRNIFTPTRRRMASNQRKIETKLQPIIDQYISIATNSQKQTSARLKKIINRVGNKRSQTVTARQSASSTLPQSITVQRHLYNSAAGAAKQQQQQQQQSITSQTGLAPLDQQCISNFDSSMVVVQKTAASTMKPNSTLQRSVTPVNDFGQRLLYLGNDPQVMDQLRHQKESQCNNEMLASCSSKLVGSNSSNIRDDDMQSAVHQYANSSHISKQLNDHHRQQTSNQSQRMVTIFHQRTKSAGNHRQGRAQTIALAANQYLASGFGATTTPASALSGAIEEKQKNHFSQGRMTLTVGGVDERTTNLQTRHFAASTSDNNNYYHGGGIESSTTTFMLSPEVRMMNNNVLDHNHSEQYQYHLAEHHRNRNNSQKQLLGNKKRSLKAKMHPNAIKSYLGLAITDPIQMTGLHKSNLMGAGVVRH